MSLGTATGEDHEAATGGEVRTLALAVPLTFPERLWLRYLLQPLEQVDSIKKPFSAHDALRTHCGTPHMSHRDGPPGNGPLRDGLKLTVSAALWTPACFTSSRAAILSRPLSNADNTAKSRPDLKTVRRSKMIPRGRQK